MNIRNVLKTYANLRQLTDDETALLNTLRSLNDSERELVVQSLQPEKAGKKSSKKPSKSKRASGLGDAIKSNLERRDAASATDGIRCAYRYPKGGINSGQMCDENADNDVHDPLAGYAGYHAFTIASLSTSTEQSATVSGG